MARITADAVGIFSHQAILKDTHGSGSFPMQVYIPQDVTATYRVVGRVSSDMPWVEILASRSTGLLEAFSYLPYVALDVTAIAGGTIVASVGEQ